MKTKRTLLIGLLTSVLSPSAFAQEWPFTYHGRLDDNGAPANGVYDFRFTIYNGPDFSGPTAALSTTPLDAVAVSNGLFTVQINGPAWVFNGQPRWLAIEVRTNGPSEYTQLAPWTELTPTPYAIRALTVTTNALDGGYPGAVNFSNPGNTFVGGGAGLTGLNASQLTSGTVPAARLGNAWRIGGNNGTTPGTHFIGNTDNQALDFRVDNRRALRLEPTGSDSVNVVGGWSGNYVGPGVVGATISGGGAGDGSGFAFTNRVLNDFGTISGGLRNTVSEYVATVGGGEENTASGNWSTVGGGRDNTAGGRDSIISGGYRNSIGSNATSAAIGGGYANQIRIDARSATIGGGYGNQILSNASIASILGGQYNVIHPNASGSTIAGGAGNIIQDDAWFASIGGGNDNTIQSNARRATISGGQLNTILTNAFVATILGGWSNTVAGRFASVGGGAVNIASGDNASVGGGYNNAAIGLDATIPGGSFNVASGDNASVGGGYNNAAIGLDATIPGGSFNVATNLAFAAGHRAKANHPGAFVWADNTAADFTSDRANQFKVRAGGGVHLVTGGSGLNPAGLRVEPTTANAVGVYIFQTSSDAALVLENRGAGDQLKAFNGPGSQVFRVDNDGDVFAKSFTPSSDRHRKENFEPICPQEMLAKVTALPITRWNFKGDEATPHVGPMAQDFHAAFGLGADDTTIATVDADGVALAAIQGLNQKLEQKETEITEVKQRLAALEQLVSQLIGGVK